MTASYGFIGLGLIGGSIARAIRAADADARIIAYDPDPTAPGQAKEDGSSSELLSPLSSPSFISHYYPTFLEESQLVPNLVPT